MPRRTLAEFEIGRQPPEQGEKAFHLLSLAPAFPDEILPSDRRSFKPEEARLYVHERGWDTAPISLREPPSLRTYEDYLDELFWRGEESPAETVARLIFLEGYVGCGKSTLINYYLKCHCPFRGKHPRKFAEKLIINIDFRGTGSIEEFDHTLYSEAKRTIEHECRILGFDIETADGYRMWNPKLGFDGETFREAAKTISDVNSFRARQVVELKARINEKDWVDLALSYLSVRAKSLPKEQRTFRYIVFCFDNLDQSSDDVIRHAVQRARSWLDHRRNDIDVWRVFIPVWPTTLEYVQEELAPLPASESVQVLAPNTEKVFQTRTAAMEDFYKEQPEADLVIEYVRNCRRLAGRGFHHFLAQLSGGSARNLLEMLRTILSSESLYRRFAIRYRDIARSVALGRYYLTDALLTGKQGIHVASTNPVLNLFTLGISGIEYRDSLIGPHALLILKSGMASSRKDMEELLGDLGYTRDAARVTLRRLRRMHLFYDVSRKMERIYILMRVVDGYRGLLEEKAYVDNMALCTPMDDDLRRLVPPAVITDPRVHFVARARAALAFLLQIKRDEESFLLDGSARFGPAEFARSLKSRGISSVYRIMADRYNEDLISLQSQRFLSDVVTDDRWSELLKHPALASKDRWPTDLADWRA